ncbi:MAG: hypothetical protein HY544_00080 [Candidatus Diapherotrites archaeon]|uniref:Uncharacterized protein n=1 Tax=Candidatus Iainarchaeum sp. TaxID=3101447 RepID=A0A8T3YHA2_9ARCH|nr:hypothetical protein [Candidatus Diapherotrites archaeon]
MAVTPRDKEFVNISKEIVEIKKDRGLLKTLRGYSNLQLGVMFILWGAFIFGMFYLSLKRNPKISLFYFLALFALMISSLGVFYYVVLFYIIKIFKFLNPGAKIKAIEFYGFEPFSEKSLVNVWSYKSSAYSYYKFSRFLFYPSIIIFLLALGVVIFRISI